MSDWHAGHFHGMGVASYYLRVSVYSQHRRCRLYGLVRCSMKRVQAPSSVDSQGFTGHFVGHPPALSRASLRRSATAGWLGRSVPFGEGHLPPERLSSMIMRSGRQRLGKELIALKTTSIGSGPFRGEPRIGSGNHRSGRASQTISPAGLSRGRSAGQNRPPSSGGTDDPQFSSSVAALRARH